MSEADVTRGAKSSPRNATAKLQKGKTGRPSVDNYAEEEKDEDSSDADDEEVQEKEKAPETKDSKKPPAYVAPIPKIGPIPPISRTNGTSPSRPTLPRFVTANLVGRRIDEYGDIVDDEGKVLGRVAGDLPSMVGRTVMNQRGDVLGDDGELLGYVAEVESDKKKAASSTPTQSIDEYMGDQKSAFRVDQMGNIVDAEGNIVGSFHDNNTMGPKPKKEEPEEEKEEEKDEEEKGADENEEERPNAQNFRKELNPSDIFLDVKSTREGIQLTIRIPTIFPGQQPRINFS